MSDELNRREFISQSVAAGVVVASSGLAGCATEGLTGRPAVAGKARVGVIGCGSVSTKYLPHLIDHGSEYAEVVSVCDIIPSRAANAAMKYGVPHHYGHVDDMLAGADFDLFVNLTDMQEHAALNRKAIEHGKHIWSEKPIANTYDEGKALLDLSRQRGLRLWGAPVVVTSNQFAFMARALAARRLGPVAAVHASYGHLGPFWASFYYEQLGGSIPDLGVYSLSTITGLFGPARSITAMTSIVTPMRTITPQAVHVDPGEGEKNFLGNVNVGRSREVEVEAEDNAMILMEFAGGVIAHVQSGFNYYSSKEHSSTSQTHHTLSVTGRRGAMYLVGYDWAPHGVDIVTQEIEGSARKTDKSEGLIREATDVGDYRWESGATLVAKALTTGEDIPVTPEHALHVVEIMNAANESQRTGRRIDLRSTFRWPVVA